jgi:uncharacterized protein HemX
VVATATRPAATVAATQVATISAEATVTPTIGIPDSASDFPLVATGAPGGIAPTAPIAVAPTPGSAEGGSDRSNLAVVVVVLALGVGLFYWLRRR